MSVESSSSPMFGLWQPRIALKQLFYGAGCVEKHLLSCLPSPQSKVYIISGNSLNTKTPLVKRVEALLGHHHAGTFCNIRQHGPVEDVDQATEAVLNDREIDTIVSIGGGTPIDTSKVISYRMKERSGAFLTHLTIPTTLSAAECTAGGGFTKADGVKIGFRAPEMGVSVIFYDPHFVQWTPKQLWLSTGMRALDHAVECMYHPCAAEVPWKVQSLWAAETLFRCLPQAKDLHGSGSTEAHDTDTFLMLAAFASSGLKGENLKGGMGLSHSLGHALGSPYGISHGVTSAMTLGKVVQLKAKQSAATAKQIARLLPATGDHSSGDDLRDATCVGRNIEDLVRVLDIQPNKLESCGVGKEQLPIIVKRALGGVEEEPLYSNVSELVESLFAPA